jgi:hypothetical protein
MRFKHVKTFLERLFRRSKPSSMPGAKDGSWQARMGWRYIAYKESRIPFGIQIEPMVTGADVVYVPLETIWLQESNLKPLSKQQVIRNLQSLSWNRELIWQETENVSFLPVNSVLEFVVPGSLESTQGGQYIESLRLFEASRTQNLSFEQAREIWLIMERRFANEARGEVTIFAEPQGIVGSVFHEVALPLLKKNPHVTLKFV